MASLRGRFAVPRSTYVPAHTCIYVGHLGTLQGPLQVLSVHSYVDSQAVQVHSQVHLQVDLRALGTLGRRASRAAQVS